MSNIAAIFGGSGFIGRYVAKRLASEGWRVLVAVRRPNEALFVRTFGVPGQVEPVIANVRNEASVQAVVQGCSAVVNCVGILSESGRQKFSSVHVDGAASIARAAAESGADRLVHFSSIGADTGSESEYARTKGAGEAAVQREFPGAVILRPSVVFGAEDEFFNRFAKMARLSLVLPIVGAATKFQPVYVGDLAKAANLAANGMAEPGIYELGGPTVEDFRTLTMRMLDVIRRKRLVLNLPVFAARPLAGSLDVLQFVSGGLFQNSILTRDQIKQLSRDNVVGPDSLTFDNLEIQPTAMELILPEYLYCYRHAGQFAEIHESSDEMKPNGNGA